MTSSGSHGGQSVSPDVHVSPGLGVVTTSRANGFTLVSSGNTPVGRISSWANARTGILNISAMCRCHARCSKIFAGAKFPGEARLVSWLAKGLHMNAREHNAEVV